MENFAPGLRESVLGLTEGLRIVVYFVCVTGLILQVQQARSDIEGLARPLVRAIVVVGLVATLPHWFGFTERVFLSVADTLHQGYTEQPMRAAAKLRDTVGGSASEFSLRRIGESMYQAFLHGTTKFVVLVASLLQLPFLALQFILKLLCYLFLPVAPAFFIWRWRSSWCLRSRGSPRGMCSRRWPCWPGRWASRSPNWSPTTCSPPMATIWRRRMNWCPGKSTRPPSAACWADCWAPCG